VSGRVWTFEAEPEEVLVVATTSQDDLAVLAMFVLSWAAIFGVAGFMAAEKYFG